MEQISFTTAKPAFNGKMICNLHKMLSLINITEGKCVSPGVSSLGRQAGKISRVTAQAFLSLICEAFT